ncbi:hypothetical protein [Derxia gummosa]|uniref:Uncharacterized protein n=1 Tax=Derxia gummosa DSM 723 TaxID=1121388 RepID=A0A8B6X0U4_9BURK|nr:hypothetical protein [Derxia gummosa]
MSAVVQVLMSSWVRRRAGLALAAVLVAGGARAEGLSLGPADAVGLTASGTGLGLSLGERVGLRLGADVSAPDASLRAEARPGLRLDSPADAAGFGAARLAALDLLADWQLGGGLKLTGGALYRQGAGGLRLLPDGAGSLGLGGAARAVGGMPGFSPGLADPGRWRLAPYVGVGWSSRRADGLGLGLHADLGLLFPAADADALAGGDAALAGRRADDELRLRDDPRFGRGQPVLSIGVNWGF